MESSKQPKGVETPALSGAGIFLPLSGVGVGEGWWTRWYMSRNLKEVRECGGKEYSRQVQERIASAKALGLDPTAARAEWREISSVR